MDAAATATLAAVFATANPAEGAFLPLALPLGAEAGAERVEPPSLPAGEHFAVELTSTFRVVRGDALSSNRDATNIPEQVPNSSGGEAVVPHAPSTPSLPQAESAAAADACLPPHGMHRATQRECSASLTAPASAALPPFEAGAPSSVPSPPSSTAPQPTSATTDLASPSSAIAKPAHAASPRCSLCDERWRPPAGKPAAGAGVFPDRDSVLIAKCPKCAKVPPSLLFYAVRCSGTSPLLSRAVVEASLRQYADLVREPLLCGRDGVDAARRAA